MKRDERAIHSPRFHLLIQSGSSLPPKIIQGSSPSPKLKALAIIKASSCSPLSGSDRLVGYEEAVGNEHTDKSGGQPLSSSYRSIIFSPSRIFLDCSQLLKIQREKLGNLNRVFFFHLCSVLLLYIKISYNSSGL